ncbi:hypothetical protein ACFL6Y_05140 [Elusimicrobiota bacterium]
MMINKKTKLAITAGLLLGFQPILWAGLDLSVDPMSAIQEESISSLDVAFAGAQKREGGYFPVNSQEDGTYRILPCPDFPDYGEEEDCEFNPVLDCAMGYKQECGRCVPDIRIPYPQKPYPRPKTLSMDSNGSAVMMLASSGSDNNNKSEFTKIAEDLIDPVVKHVEKKIEDKYDNSRRGAVEAAKKYGGCRMNGNCPK